MRCAEFLLALLDRGLRFLTAAVLDANDLAVGILALAAQQAREVIARRTREALEAAKARGNKRSAT